MKITNEELAQLIYIEIDLIQISHNFNLLNTNFYTKDIKKISELTSRMLYHKGEYEFSLQDIKDLNEIETSLLSLDIIGKIFETDFKYAVLDFHTFIQFLMYKENNYDKPKQRII